MQPLDRTFNALSDTTRRAILTQLMEKEQALSQLAEPHDMSLTAISKHVKVLTKAGLVSVEKRGRTHYCQLQARPMQQAVEWLNHYQQFWTDQFESLAHYLEASESSKPNQENKNK